MNEKKRFLKIYFWVLFIFTTVSLFEMPSDDFTIKDVAQTLFTYFGFIALYGYAYHKIIFNQHLWKAFIIPFFIWEIACYFFITKITIDSIIVFLILVPKYWSIVRYTYITHEADEKRKSDFQKISDTILYTVFPFLDKGRN